MKRNIARNEPGRLVAWFAVCALVGGCAEAPSIADDDDGAGNEQVSAGAESEEARTEEDQDAEDFVPEEREEDGLDAGAPQEGEAEPPHSEEEHEEEHELAPDAELDAARDASAAPASDAAPSVADAAADASAEEASLPRDPCAAKPCQHEGICAGEGDRFTCACPEGFSGQQCEHKVCGGVTIRARSDVEANRECGEIRGDLSIASIGLTHITAEDFPFLTKVSGNLVISGAQATDDPRLESVTLAKLREVEGAVMVVGLAVVELGGSGPLRELHLPALERAGALAAYQANLKLLDLPALTTIKGAVLFHTLLELCTVNLDAVEQVGGKLTINYVPRVSPAQLGAMRAVAGEPVSERVLGCCASGPEQQVSCDDFTERARALHCSQC